MWKEGAILIRGKVYKYQAKVYEEGSEYGIEGGRVSKVMIKHDGEIVVKLAGRAQECPFISAQHEDAVCGIHVDGIRFIAFTDARYCRRRILQTAL